MEDVLMAKQTGSEYREKNRIRLQRFYDRQAASGKKRVSALVSDEAYRLLTDQKEQSGESMSTLIDQAVRVAYGQQGIPDIMSDEAYALLMDAKEHTGESMPVLIDRAVMAAYGAQDILDVDDVSGDFLAAYGGPDPADTQEPDTTPDQVDPPSAVKVDDLGDQIPDCTGKTITIEQRDRILVQVAEALPGKENIQARVDLLNKKAVPVSIKAGKHSGAWDKKKFSNNLRLAKKRMSEQKAPDTDTAQGDQVADQIPDCTEQEITLEQRDKILVQVMDLLPGRNNAQARVDEMNRKGIPVSLKPGQYGGTWDRKKFTDNLRFAKKRLGIK
jgi:hypothetical protein